ncbi:MAG TPA: hypothetical protein VLY24_05995 [Bryobacteraceae bacterium]|nr:hypothetical protein [Bryobacteraceae bacterium]
MHCSDDTVTGTTGASSEIDALAEELLSFAVTVAVRPVDIVPAVAVKLALLLPAATVTDAGTVKLVEFELRVTVAPPVPAGLLKLTVQVEDPAELNDAGQDRELTVVAAPETVIVPPVLETATDEPAREAPMALVRLIAAVVAPLVKVAVTTATTPLEIILALMPAATHIYAAAPPVHEMDLPAAVAAAPAITLMLATLAAG